MSDCTCGRDAYDGPGAGWLSHGPSCRAPFVRRDPIIRYAEIDGKREFDEFVADNATVHFEAMGETSWWMQVDAGGRSWHINCGVSEDGPYARCDEVT